MNTQIFQKVLEGHNFLTASDLSPQDKEILYNEMIKYGSTRGFAYDRFFNKGFKKWELSGIIAIKMGFITENISELRDSHHGEDDFNKKLSYDYIYNPGEFYQLIGSIRGMKDKFKIYMGELGMCEATVVKRFGCDDDKWKQYELIGVRAVINGLTDKK